MCNPADFSSVPAMLGPNRFPIVLIPVETDPPEHTLYRQILATYFSPRAVKELIPRIRAVCAQVVREIAPKGQCNFVTDVAQKVPTMIFAEMMGVPFSEVPLYLRWVHDLLHNHDVEAARRTGEEIFRYLAGLINKRRGEPPTDLITILLNAKVGDRPITDDEVNRYAFLVFSGGLDTLIAVMGYTFRYLAEQPELRRRLVAEPAQIDNCAHEMFRRFSVVSRARHTTRDLTFRGVEMKKGDGILVAGSHASLDPQMFPDPLEVALGRAKLRSHGAFGYGPHSCIGAFLAVAELQELLRAWLAAVLEFEIVPGTTFTHYTGVFGLPHCPMQWDVATTSLCT
jgi:cytochrome P450